jgi:transposase
MLSSVLTGVKMYLEVEKRLNSKNQESWRVKICENERLNGKPKKKTIRNVGTCKAEKEIELLKRHGLKLIEIEMDKRNGGLLFDGTSSYSSCDISSKNIDYKKLKEEKRISEGVGEVYGQIFEECGFSNILKGDQAKILKEIVIARIKEPASKRKTQEILERDCNFKTSLDSIYRMVTALSKKTDKLIEKTFEQANSLFQEKLDIVFFDVSTLYFESFIQDELRDFGYSKDNKFKETQVVLALAITREGLPLGYKLFPGNTAETKTLLTCLDTWKNYIDIHRVVFVADRGMFNYINLLFLEESGYEFIVAAKLRALEKVIKNQITDSLFFSKEKCKIHNDIEKVREINHKIKYKDPETKEKHIIEGKLIVSHTLKRAKKDFNDREKLINKIKKVIGKTKADAKKLVTNKGYTKFVHIKGDIVSEIREDKILEDQKWDGIHGLFTNADLSPEEILTKYRDLWQIEAAFRISKNDLSMRPIYHSTKSRIEGHIAICFMALFLVQKTQLILKRNNIKLSPERITFELERVQASILYDKSNAIRFRMPSNMSTDAKIIYKCLRIDRDLSIQKY